MPDLEVLCDGRGPLDDRDWPPQRWRPEYTWEVTTADAGLPGHGCAPLVCPTCHRTVRIPQRKKRAGQTYCSPRCYRASHAPGLWAGRRP